MKFIALFVVLVAIIATQAAAHPAAPTWEGNPNGSPYLPDWSKDLIAKILDMPDKFMRSSGSSGLGSGLMF